MNDERSFVSFGRICNPTALSISIFNAKKDNITYNGLQILDTLTRRITNPTGHKCEKQWHAVCRIANPRYANIGRTPVT